MNEPVIVWTLPNPWPDRVPSPSPFVGKLLTWLRMAELPHDVRELQGMPRSSTGKVPYIERPDGSVLSESGTIQETLAAERGVDLDAGLSPERLALAHVLARAVEEHLYFALLWERWGDAAGWAVTGPAYFPSFPLNVIRPFIRRKVVGSAWGQGIGRLPADAIRARAARDLEAIARLLGDREWPLDQPSTLDAVLFGFLGNLLGAPVPTPTVEALRGHENLVAYLERVRTRWWPELAPLAGPDEAIEAVAS